MTMETLLSPKTLARVKDMPLVAKAVADGFLHGVQNSAQRGLGIEFSQYRSYEPGDALSRIDWKLFARSDRYFIREAERESEINIWLVVDASASMSLSSQQGGGWDKLNYARHLAATLAYIGQRQGDKVGLLGLSTQQLHFLAPATGQQHWHRLMAQLTAMHAGERFPSSHLIKQYNAQLQQPSLVVVISDFYQHNNEISDFLAQVSGRHNEVCAIALQSHDELNFPYQGPVRFKDLESKEEVLLSAKSAQQGYFQALYRHQQQLKQQLASLNVSLSDVEIGRAHV